MMAQEGLVQETMKEELERGEEGQGVLWDVFLYVVNMCSSHWLINKAVLAYVKAG